MKIAFSPDSSTLVSSSVNPDRTVVLWDVETGDVLKSVEVTPDILTYSEDEDSRFSNVGSFIRDLVFSSDGQSVYIIGTRLAYGKWYLASSSVDVIKADANVSMPMSLAAAVQPNAGRLAIGVADGGVLLFDLSGGLLGKVDSSQAGTPQFIDISPAGDLLAIGSLRMFGADPLLGGGISLWDAKSATSRGFLAPPTGSEFRSSCSATVARYLRAAQITVLSHCGI